MKGSKSKRCLDTSTVANETSWYHAEDHWAEIRSFCKAWDGVRNLNLVSVFDRSKKMSQKWVRQGLAAEAYDINHDTVGMDIVTHIGFFTLLSLLMQLLPQGLSFWAPPCSLFIFLTSSLHLRHLFGPGGNVAQYAVRLSNRISMNACMAVKATLKFRSDCQIMAEQPSGSWLFKDDHWQKIIAGFHLHKSLTYQGLFGCPIPKPTHLLHSFRSDTMFARKLTKKLREKHRFNKDAQKVYYIKSSDGHVQGTKMLTKTSVYPAGLPSRSTGSGLTCTVGFESPTACGWIDFWGASKKV